MGIEHRARRWIAGAVVLLAVGNVSAVAVHEPTTRAAPRVVLPAAPGPTAAPAVTASTTTKPVAAPATPGKTPAAAKAQNPTDPAAKNWAAEWFPLRSEGYQFEVVFAPTCARVGDVFNVTLKLKPKWGSAGTIMPFYSDGTNEEGKGAVAEADGTITYSWVARPIPGEGRLVTQGQDADTFEFGTKVLPFRVVEVTQSC